MSVQEGLQIFLKRLRQRQCAISMAATDSEVDVLWARGASKLPLRLVRNIRKVLEERLHVAVLLALRSGEHSDV